MKTVKLVALRRHPFGTGEREQGEEYEAPADVAKTLKALGWAEAAKGEPEDAADVAETEVEEEETPKRAYQRKDMKAKG